MIDYDGDEADFKDDSDGSFSIERVVSFGLSDDGKYISAREECDDYFSAQLFKKDVDGLINRLISLRARMTD